MKGLSRHNLLKQYSRPHMGRLFLSVRQIQVCLTGAYGAQGSLLQRELSAKLTEGLTLIVVWLPLAIIAIYTAALCNSPSEQAFACPPPLTQGRLWCGTKSHITHYTERCIEVRYGKLFLNFYAISLTFHIYNIIIGDFLYGAESSHILRSGGPINTCDDWS